MLNKLRNIKIARTLITKPKYSFSENFYQSRDLSDLDQMRNSLQSQSVNLELPEMKKMVYWKATHLGINELEIIVRRYLDDNMENMSKETLWEFYLDVVERESDYLFSVLLGMFLWSFFFVFVCLSGS